MTIRRYLMLTGKQRSYLKGIANGMTADLYIGKAGVTDMVIKSIDDNLKANEMVKVQIQEGAELDPKEVANEIAPQLKAEFVQAIGRRFVLYRQNPNPDKRKIML